MTLSGDPMEVFSHVARMIGELMDVKVVCLSEVQGPTLAFLSVYVNGKIFTNAGGCPLAVTPCSTVESSRDIRIYDQVIERFPEASFLKDHNAYSYCGFPSIGNDGHVLAVTCLLDDRPHEFTEDDLAILRIFGQRIGMEIERQHYLVARMRAEEEIRNHRDHLERLVQERTEELRKNEEHFRLIVANTPDHLIVQDRDLRYTLVVNPQLGLTEKDMLGRTDYDFLSADDAAKLTRMKRRVLENGETIHTETSLKDTTGGEQFFDGYYVPRFDANGTIDGVIGYFRNVTEQKKLERQIRRLNNELGERAHSLEVSNEALESFSYSVSHDLRAPLQLINGYAQLLQKNYAEKIDAEGNRLIAAVTKNALRMGNLIRDLLRFAQIDRCELAMQRVDMDAMVHSVRDELNATEPQHTIEFTIAPLHAAFGDPAMLKQVWTNLLTNAVKFTRQRELPRIEIGSRNDGGEIVYWVKDNGAGFDMSHAEKLFRAFERLHRQDQFEGTGVGLAIVQSVIRRHRGRIWAEGKPDEGATFYFALPMQPPDEPSSQSS